MLKGVIFDMDGVLTSTESYHFEAIKILSNELDIPLSDKAIEATRGRRNEDVIPNLLGRTVPEEELSRLIERKEEIFRALLAPHLTPVKGVVDFLFELQNHHFKIALATSAYKKNVAFILDGLSIRNYFHALVTEEDVNIGKPDPEPFLLASKRLSLPPESCIVFEDSEAGILSAQNAGCPCIALATSLSTEDLLSLSPHKIIPDFTQITLDDLKNMLRKKTDVTL